jgi:Flp pilus assembly protein TadG
MRRNNKGQIAVIIALAIPILVGAAGLSADIGVQYFNWVQLQKAADAAVLAGANYLPDNPDQAATTAQQLAQANGVQTSEITSNTVAADHLSIVMQVQRTVPYYFAKVLGLTSGIVIAKASAGAQFPPSTVGASSPSQIPPGGDNNGNNGTTCANTAQCGLIPIGLDYNTTYTDGTQIVLQQGQVGAGNWDLLALGGVGGNNLRSNIADGYNGQVSVGDWLTTEPGKKVGPVDQGFQDRLDLALSVDPSGTSVSHKVNNPRVLVVPVVDWEHPNGRSLVQVKAFASVWLDSYSGGKVRVHFISQVVANSFGDPSAPYFGSRGTPTLIK